MTISYTHTTLTQEIQDLTEDDSTEFTNEIDNFIARAEMRIYRETDLDVARKYSTGAMTASSRYLAKPSDFVVDRFMSITVSSEETHLDQKDPTWLTFYWPNASSEGTPKYYADWDNDTWLIAPTPDSAYVVTLGYTYRPAAMTSSNTTTWLGDNAGDVLLYAALVEAGIFLQELGQGAEPGMLQTWEQIYQQRLLGLKGEEHAQQRKSEYRTGAIKHG